MEGFSPVGRAAGSSIVGRGEQAIGRIAGGLKWPQWSEKSEVGKAVGTGMGTRLEQPGPEQGAGRFGTCPPEGSRAMSSEVVAFEPAISASSRLKSTDRSDFETTRWLQPAQAERGAPRPWTRSTINAPAAHRASRSKRMDLITPSPPNATRHARADQSGIRILREMSIRNDHATDDCTDQDTLSRYHLSSRARKIVRRVRLVARPGTDGTGHSHPIPSRSEASGRGARGRITSVGGLA